MYEISNNTGQFCLECNNELGYLNPELRTFYKGASIKTQSAFSDRLHPKFNKKRQRCFDCSYNKFNNITYRPNISHSEYAGYLFDSVIDTSVVAITLENMIKKYGEIQGKIKFDEYRKRQAYTNTLEYFVEKYGYEKGKKEYDRICSEKANTLQNMIRVYGPEIGPMKYENFIKNISLSSAYSAISQELFWKIDNTIKEYSYFAEKNNEFAFVHHEGCYLFDFVVPSIKKIIEFNGDYWHANPAIYESTWINATNNLTAEEIWKYDRDKNRFAEKMGYSVFVVWENDYRENKNEVVERCLEFLNEN